MLATALELEEVFGIKIDAFHTFGHLENLSRLA